MKKRNFLLLVVFVFTLIAGSFAFYSKSIFIQKPLLIFPQGSTYDKEWTKADSLKNIGLNRSALKIVQGIYNKAKTDTNHAQLAKAIINRIVLESQYEEEAYVKAIDSLTVELENATYPLTPILHSITANVYWNYYQQNRWKFHNRTTTQDFENNDIRTWDLKKLLKETIYHHQQALASTDSLQRTLVDTFEPILIVEQKETRKLRPTLYDFLAHRAIDFYSNSESSITQPSYAFEVNNPAYFQLGEDFSTLKIQTRDSLSLDFFALKELQNLTQFHLKDTISNALVDVELKRLAFVKRASVLEEKDSLYYGALRKLYVNYNKEEPAADVGFAIASFYQEKARLYNPAQGDDYKDFYQKAIAICDSVIQQFPKSTGAINCNYLKSSIKTKSYSLTTDDVVEKGKPAKVLLNYKNIEHVYFRVVPIDNEKYAKLTRKKYGKELIEELTSITPVKEWDVKLNNEDDYQNHAVETTIPALDYGHYIVLVASDKSFSTIKQAVSFSPLWVSDISYLSRQNPNGTYDFTVLNRTSGEPLKGVQVAIFEEKYNYILREYEFKKHATYTSDANGFVNAGGVYDYRYFKVEFKKGEDQLTSGNNFYQYRNYDDKRRRIQTHFFTDRGIYRPGQTIYFKGILIEAGSRGEDPQIKTNYKSKVYLYDVNYQKVSELELTTNEFGTFSGTFTAPASLNGQMHIQDSHGSIYFSVEEYKRPRFEVNFESIKESYKLNEKVKVTGVAKAFAGSSIDGAAVKYRVVRNASFPSWCFYRWGYQPYSAQMEITHGEVIANEKGEFDVEFIAVPDKSITKKYKPTYSYTVYADVTDINGETHTAQQYLAVGYSALVVNINMPSQLNISKNDTFKISTTNLSGEPISAEGVIQIHRLNAPDKLYRARKWAKPDQFLLSKKEHDEMFKTDVYNDENDIYKWEKGARVFESKFNTALTKELLLKGKEKWVAGNYVMEAIAKDKDGEEVKQVIYFTVFNDKSKVAPVNDYSWFYLAKSSAQPGDTIDVLIASGAENVKVLYETEHQDKLVKKEWISLNKEMKKIRIPIEEKHRGNLSLHFTFVKDNRSYSYNPMIYVDYTNKKLDIEFETFRNKLLPGQQEEWKIKLKGPKGEKVAAEMLAAMYDASLDEFRANNWYFNIYGSYYNRLNWQNNNSFGSTYSQQHSHDWNIISPNFNRIYDELNWFGYNNYGRYRGYNSLNNRSGGDYFNSVAATGMVMDVEFAEAEVMALEEVDFNRDEKSKSEGKLSKNVEQNQSQTVALGGALADETVSKDKAGGMGEIKARSNFNETAFFFPHLQTNEEGEVIINFTVPESLTKWKFMSLSHTKDLKYGTLMDEVVTQKELMVMPNAPRFFREGDKMTFSSKISNLSEKDMKGTAQLFFFDAITLKPIDAKFISGNTQRKFEVKKDQSTVVYWNISIPDDVQAVTYKVVAKSNKFTDGEEMVVPILSNRMLVTEAMPLPIRGNSTKVFNFNKLLNSSPSGRSGGATLKHHKLTLEFSSNPAWYAVQAMPFMMEYPYECSEQVFTRYYANSLSSHIANSNPKIKAVFESWKNKSPEALLSNLEKNQELKSLILEETPWVLNAQNETERKKRLGLLFDLNRMSDEMGRAFTKLEKAQSANGGWPWFPGMEENRFITQHVVTGFGHLDNLGVKDVRLNSRTWNMLQKAIRYLDDRIKDDYDWLVKHKVDLDKNHLSATQIQYLYARSYFKDLVVSSKNKKAFDYYLKQSEKYWVENNRYMQGMITLAQHRFGVKTIPMKIIKSLKENALFSDEMGMYWKDNYENYYWYQAPIESQALLIEAFDEVADDQKSVEEMKIWLLKSKQTQDWKTTKATVEACYALLLKGTDLLANDKLVVVQLGNMTVDPKKIEGVNVEEGTGYFKTSWNKDEIKPEWGKVKVTKNNEGVAWGALYWQYFEQLDKIIPHKTPLKLDKKLFLEEIGDAGKVIKPITEKTKLNLGDKVIVRIELRVDRDMEFVHMKDMRAAGFEPINVISRYKWKDGLGYYESTKDAATNFFFDYLPKGTYVFEYPLRVSQIGDFSNGITTIQNMYAPEFTSHSEGIRVKVGE
ncbi:MAG: hypothetical protein H6587_04100 [Flavobacteriales bacterium]|nr:hypothetical protein [Flavobacteriales bacterium]MCB9363731.1 hypothetical protein [Flavobacteriales bacterium]